MQIKKASFLISNSDYTKCPESNIPEYAFIGRSNVGKSSLINMLTNINDLAKTSSKPGKTQLINHFLINEKEWYLVDLPGYGYAQASKESKEKWKKMIEQYLLNRENLYCVFVLVDTRLSPQIIDIKFMTWLGEKQIPFCIVGTKADKVSSLIVKKNIVSLEKELLKTFTLVPQIFITSAEKRMGKDQILDFIDTINKS
ncbi:MAG: ribosome biogenesis GTP-binding protein YihA/YsxC [Bacteroidales bacterium]